MDAYHILASVARALLCDRQRLILENLALRQQVPVLRRGVARPKLEDKDRIFWIGLMRMLDTWREALLIVQPEPVIKWHRQGWKHYWRRKSKPKRVGRPAIGWVLVHLIKRLSRENPLWGAPRIAAELALLGHEVAEATVAKYMVRHRPVERGQSWRTFLANHLDRTIACDFFTVLTVTFRSLFVFVALHHGSRRILHVGVTEHPTAEWTGQQLVEALGDEDAPVVTHLVRDRDSIFGDVFQRKVTAFGIEDVVTPKASPWCNGIAERVIGTLRRECTDHIIPLGERHLGSVLREYVAYYNTGRCHQGLDGDSPVPRRRWEVEDGDVQAAPILGGLHHVYSRAA
jgi:transposase InsO family protein